MILLTAWKTRPLSPEQQKRMMAIWGAQLERTAKDPAWKPLSFYMYADGSGGISLAEVTDYDKANARGLQESIELSEFLELDSRPVLTQEQAMPAILAAMASISS
jgi:hypothetical protein